jgi:hypothetical protein
MLITIHQIGEPINIFRIIGSLAVVGLFAFMGWCLAFTGSTIFHRTVDRHVELEDLVKGRTYWLNGETSARFVGKNNYTGKYHFHIDGLDDPNDDDDDTAIIPGLVIAYFSPVQEVFPPLYS